MSHGKGLGLRISALLLACWLVPGAWGAGSSFDKIYCYQEGGAPTAFLTFEVLPGNHQADAFLEYWKNWTRAEQISFTVDTVGVVPGHGIKIDATESYLGAPASQLLKASIKINTTTGSSILNVWLSPSGSPFAVDVPMNCAVAKAQQGTLD